MTKYKDSKIIIGGIDQWSMIVSTDLLIKIAF